LTAAGLIRIKAKARVQGIIVGIATLPDVMVRAVGFAMGGGCRAPLSVSVSTSG